MARTLGKRERLSPLTGFGSSSMDFEVTWWSGATPVDQRRSRNEVVEAVKRALDKAGIEIPYPYRVLTFTKNEPLIYQQLGEDKATDSLVKDLLNPYL